MKSYDVNLKGFHNEVLFKLNVKAEDKAHAVKIVSAVYNKCWRNAEAKEVTEVQQTVSDNNKSDFLFLKTVKNFLKLFQASH